MTGVAILKMETTGAAILRASNSSATILQGVEGVGPPGPPGSGGGAPTDASYVVLSLDGDLTDERVLTAGTGITLTDGGAGSTVTVAVDRDTDGTLAANSDSKIATQKATKTYADGKVPKSTVTAKGDLIAATGSGAVTNVAVGADGAPLIADAASSAGVKYQPNYHHMAGTSGASTTYLQLGYKTTTQAITQNRMYLLPIYFPYPVAIDRLGVEVASGVATSVCRVGFYSSTAGLPTTLLFEAGSTLDTSGTGTKEATVSQTLPAGLLWFACVSQTAAANLYVVDNTTAIPTHMWGQNSSWLAGPTSRKSGYYVGSVTGAMASTISVTLTNVDRFHPLPIIRAA